MWVGTDQYGDQLFHVARGRSMIFIPNDWNLHTWYGIGDGGYDSDMDYIAPPPEIAD